MTQRTHWSSGTKLFLTVCLSALLFSCATDRSLPNMNLSQPQWRFLLDNDPHKWTKEASHWFLTGEPNLTELNNLKLARQGIPMRRERVNVENFNKIRFNGNYQLQIFGTDGPNTVYIYGPSQAAATVRIRVSGGRLCIDQDDTVPLNSDQVIIRVGIRDLQEITHLGCGSIEGIWLKSSGLLIQTTANSANHIYLAGDLRVRRIAHAGFSSITLTGVNTQYLDIQAMGFGDINLCGKVGIQSINHHAGDNINIIGANSPHLVIIADGQGKIGISGRVNLREVTATDSVRIYISQVLAPFTNILLKKYAQVGLLGVTDELFVKAYDSSRFDGRGLCTHEAHVKSFDNAHINFNSANAISMASNHSSIYYFGAERRLISFIHGNGLILPLFDDAHSCQIINRTYIVKQKPRMKLRGLKHLRGEG